MIEGWKKQASALQKAVTFDAKNSKIAQDSKACAAEDLQHRAQCVRACLYRSRSCTTKVVTAGYEAASYECDEVSKQAGVTADSLTPFRDL